MEDSILQVVLAIIEGEAALGRRPAIAWTIDVEMTTDVETTTTDSAEMDVSRSKRSNTICTHPQLIQDTKTSINLPASYEAIVKDDRGSGFQSQKAATWCGRTMTLTVVDAELSLHPASSNTGGAMTSARVKSQ